MSNGDSMRFWFKGRFVNGSVVVQTEAGVLLFHQKHYFVINNQEPDKPVQYTKSALPAKWKRLLTNGLGTEQGKELLTFREPLLQQQQSAPIDVLTKQEPSTPQSKGFKEVQAKLKDINSPPPTVKENPVESKEGAPPPSEKKQRTPRKKPVKVVEDANFVEFLCPDCGAKHTHQSTKEEAFIKTCDKCKQLFGVKIEAVTTYKAQTAAFRP